MTAPLPGRGRRPLLATGLAALLLLPACSGPDDVSPQPAEATTSSASPTERRTVDGATLPGRWPLTGRPARGRAPRRPVLVVKIDNTASSDPQLGLGRADLVVEELVEGGQTRLAAMFYEKVPAGRVGPVRSLRASDIGIVSPLDTAVMVTSGGAGPTVRRVDRAGIRFVQEGAPGFERAGDRVAPYNLMMRLPRLARTLAPPRAVPPAYLPWGEQPPRGPRVRRVDVTFSAARTTSWRYARGRYTEQGSLMAQGDVLRPDTVLALEVEVGDAGYLDPAGNPVPETRFVGTGPATLFHGGRMVRGTWSKRSRSAPVTLRTSRGRLLVPPGRTWIELVPRTGGAVSAG